jgi:hypothetical protein
MNLVFSGLRTTTGATGHVFPFFWPPPPSYSNPVDMDPHLNGFSCSYYFCQVFQYLCVKQKYAVGQPLNLQTLPFFLLLFPLLLVVLISRAEACLRWAITRCWRCWFKFIICIKGNLACAIVLQLMDEILHHLTWVTCRKWEESGMGVRGVRDESEMRMRPQGQGLDPHVFE